MKKLFYILLILPFFSFSQSDTTYNSDNKIISINQNGIDELVEKYKTILINKGGINGWRIQIKFKEKKEDILAYQIKFTNLFPDISATIDFKYPYYKLIVGNFRTRNEALKIKHQISKHFPGAHPIPCVINPDLLKK